MPTLPSTLIHIFKGTPPADENESWRSNPFELMGVNLVALFLEEISSLPDDDDARISMLHEFRKKALFMSTTIDRNNQPDSVFELPEAFTHNLEQLMQLDSDTRKQAFEILVELRKVFNIPSRSEISTWPEAKALFKSRDQTNPSAPQLPRVVDETTDEAQLAEALLVNLDRGDMDEEEAKENAAFLASVLKRCRRVGIITSESLLGLE